jgi:hypothetical protein
MNLRPRIVAALFATLLVHCAPAQSGDESRIHSDFRREWLELHPCQQQLV